MARGRTPRAYDHPVYRNAKRRMGGLPCHWCGEPADTVDHVVALADGGSNTLDNLVPACRRCNFQRGGRVGGRRSKARARNTSHPRY